MVSRWLDCDQAVLKSKAATAGVVLGPTIIDQQPNHHDTCYPEAVEAHQLHGATLCSPCMVWNLHPLHEAWVCMSSRS